MHGKRRKFTIFTLIKFKMSTWISSWSVGRQPSQSTLIMKLSYLEEYEIFTASEQSANLDLKPRRFIENNFAFIEVLHADTYAFGSNRIDGWPTAP